MKSSTILKNPSLNNALSAPSANVRTIPLSAAAVLRPSPDPDDGDGPYFDLEFSVPQECNISSSSSTSDADENEEESTSGRRSSHRSDDLFFKDRSSLLFTPSSKSKPQFPSSLLKSATKFRFFMLRFKKPKPSSSKNKGNGSFMVKLKVEEIPIVSLFAREHSSVRSAKLHAEDAMQSPASTTTTADEKKTPKDVIQRYLNKIKPLYVRTSKRYGDKLRFSGQLAANDPISKRLRKSRSASAAVASVRSPPRHRDDSLVQQEDGIQSAIAHCKRSFSAGSEALLARCRSDPGGERCD